MIKITHTNQSTLYQHHSKELKFRLIYIILTWVISFLIAFYNMEFILYKVLIPVQYASNTPQDNNMISSSVLPFENPITEQSTKAADFIFTEIFEAFFSYLILSGYIAFIITLPILYYHLYQFLLPGTTFTESALLKILFYFSCFLLLIAHVLTYFVIIPYATAFLLTFQSNTVSNTSFEYIITPSLTFLGRVYPWITFIINLFTIVSTLFHLPLFLFILFLYFKGLSILRNNFLYNLNLTTPRILDNAIYKVYGLNFVDMSFFRKLLFFTLVLLTAVFSPPDLYSQIFLFIPLFFIIEFFIFAVFIYVEYLKKASSYQKPEI